MLKAEGPLATAGQQLLVLRNGQAVAGQISLSGDIYHVALPDGQIRVKAAEVEFVCRDFEEGYQRKRAAIPLGSLSDHLDLAQWCQRHKLYDHAAAELAEAAAIAPKNPLVGLLQRRMQMALTPPPEPPQKEITRDGSLSNEELDRMMRGLPHKTMENFSQAVQPLLMNNCTSSGCHGPQSDSGFRLERIPLGQPTGRRVTQRNLYAVLQYVDRNNPLSSKILTAATAPHATVKTAIFTEHQAPQWNLLVDWVRQLGPASQEKIPTNLAAEPLPAEDLSTTKSKETTPRVLSPDARKGRALASFLQAGAAVGPSGGSWMDNPAVKSAGKVEQATFPEPVADQKETTAKASKADASPSKIKRGATLPKFTLKDPFDAEIFNRRFLGNKKPEKADSESAKASEK